VRRSRGQRDEGGVATSVRRTITRNTAFNTLGRLWEAAANLVLTAYIVPRVGLAAWGLWALVSVFTSYVALLDFGIGSGFAKYIAEHAARDEEHEMSSVVSTGLCFYLLLGVVVVAVGWPCIDPLIALFARLHPARAQGLDHTAFLADVRFLLRWGLVLFAVSNCVAAFTAIQIGLQRMGITNVVAFVASIIKVVATVAFLEGGHGVRGLLFANAAVMAFFAAASVAIAFRLAPSLRVRPGCVKRETMRRLFSYGWRTQVSRLSNILTFQTDRAIVALVYMQFGLVGVYRIGEEFAGKMRQAPALLLSAIIPAASDLDARGDEERLRRLYLLSSKYVCALTIPLVAFCAGSAGALLRTWMGTVPHLDVSAWVLRVLAVGYLANVIPGAAASIALGKGRPDVQMKAGIIAMVSNLLLTVALVLSIGFYGIPLATALSMFLSCAWFLAAMRPLVGVGLTELVRVSVLWPAVASLPGLAVCAAGDWLAADLVGRWPNGALVAVCAVAFAAMYLAVIRCTSFLDAFDLDFLGNTLRLKRLPGFRAWAGHK